MLGQEQDEDDDHLQAVSESDDELHDYQMEIAASHSIIEEAKNEASHTLMNDKTSQN